MTTPTAGAVEQAGDVDPGASLGLPASGAGSLSSWRARVAALIADWAVAMIVAAGLFGTRVLRGHDWRSVTPSGVFLVETALMSALTGSSIGMLLARIGIVRLDRRPLGWLRALARSLMVSLVLPTVVIGAERRALDDLVLGTVVVNRR